MFHGFLSDEIFRKSSTVERYESLPEVCYLDDQERAYFYDLVTVTDPNTDRNKIGSSSSDNQNQHRAQVHRCC